MARRRLPEQPAVAPPAPPPELAAGCIVEDWLPPDHQTPDYLIDAADPERSRRDHAAIVAWFRWRRARDAWAAAHRITRADLAALVPMRSPRRRR